MYRHSAFIYGAFMTEKRNLRLDLFALGLLAIAAFLALALLTYNPADPIVELVAPFDRLFQPDVLVHPQNPTVRNACGQWGALLATMMLTGLGVGAYYLVISLGILDTLLLMRRQIDAPLVRAFGWAVSLIGLTTVAAIVVPSWSPGPMIGSGGYVGALGSGLLEMHFATIGSLILATSFILGGLLLSTDYALMQVARLVLDVTITGVANGRSIIPTRKSVESSGKKTDLSEEELSIRIGGMAVGEDEEADDEQSEEDDQWEDDEEDAVEEDEKDEAVVVKAKANQSSKKDRPASTGPRVLNRNTKSNERQQVMQSLDEASLQGDAGDYELPSLDLLSVADDVCFEAQSKEVRRKAKILERTFANFGFNVKVVEIETGPVIAQYEVELEAGLRLSKITGLADDLAIALRVPSVRIVAPIPGKNSVGIEVPNEIRQVVRLREVMEETNGKMKTMKIPIFLGKDVSGNPLTVDLATMPHLLIAGRTGTGKSVCLNAIISSILMTRRPDEVRMLMIDPKMVELSGYGRLPHLMHPVVTDMRKAEAILAWAVDKMEERYSLLARAGVRHISSYNQLGKEELIERLQPESDEQREAIPDRLPFIVIVADEIADLMMTAGKEVEQHIIRLAQKSRAVGIHLILATQKPTVDVITGLIKSNLPARISFQVASRTDSRVVLDEMGADKLLGNGDMLFLWPGTSTLVRGQGTYLSDDEINAVIDVVSTGEQNFVNELVNIKVDSPQEGATPEKLRKRDDLYESAIDVVVREGRGSVSLLQRTLGIGYGRAARLIDFMAEDGIVGEYNGSQAREVVISTADWEQMQGLEPTAEPAPTPKAKRANVVLPDPMIDDDDDDDDDDEDAPPVAKRKRGKKRPAKKATKPFASNADADELETRDASDEFGRNHGGDDELDDEAAAAEVLDEDGAWEENADEGDGDETRLQSVLAPSDEEFEYEEDEEYDEAECDGDEEDGDEEACEDDSDEQEEELAEDEEGISGENADEDEFEPLGRRRR